MITEEHRRTLIADAKEEIEAIKVRIERYRRCGHADYVESLESQKERQEIALAALHKMPESPQSARVTENRRAALIAAGDRALGMHDGDIGELIEIALAALAVKPDHYVFNHPDGPLFNCLVSESCRDDSRVIPGYIAPPVQTFKPVIMNGGTLKEDGKIWYTNDRVARILREAGYEVDM